MLRVIVERWPLARPFAIARGSKTEAVVVVATLRDGAIRGRGEGVPYPRYGETVEGVVASLQAMGGRMAGLTRQQLLAALPAGAARNALDCALWDLEAKRTATPAAALAGLAAPRPLPTAFTISLDTPRAMAEMAGAARSHPLLKLKLGADGDEERLDAVRAARPEARIIVDANEGWRPERLEELLAACARAGVAMVEQPLPAGADEALAAIARPVPVCADESVHTRADLAALRGRYDAVNVKLDKAGGLTEALAMVEEARTLGFRIMVGCMAATSLSLAPAMLAAQKADLVDLDGALLLARDRQHGLRYEAGQVWPPTPALWG